MIQEETEQLHVHERIAVLFIISLLLVLAAVTWKNQTKEFPNNTGAPHYIIDPNITVHLEGAVQNPGPIALKRGATVGDVIQKAILNPEADLSKIKNASKLRNKQKIQIPEKQKITVHVSGALQNTGEFQLYKGSKISDLLPKLELNENASRDKLQLEKGSETSRKSTSLQKKTAPQQKKRRSVRKSLCKIRQFCYVYRFTKSSKLQYAKVPCKHCKERISYVPLHMLKRISVTNS